MKLIDFYREAYLPQHVMVENRVGMARQVIGSFEKYILPMFGERDLTSFRQIDWVMFRNKLKLLGLSPKTIKNHQGYLRHLMNTAVEWEVIENFPVLKSVKVEAPDVDYLRAQEIEPFLRSAAQDKELYYTMFRLALKTGMRIGELRGLQWQDIEVASDKIIIHIKRSVPGRQNEVGPTKSGRSRIASVSLEFIEMLPHGNIPSSYIFSNPDKPLMPLTYKAVDCAIKRIARRAFMRDIGWHTIRHTVATYLVGKEIPLVQVCAVLGHVDIRTTQRYVHIDAGNLTTAFAALDHF